MAKRKIIKNNNFSSMRGKVRMSFRVGDLLKHSAKSIAYQSKSEYFLVVSFDRDDDYFYILGSAGELRKIINDPSCGLTIAIPFNSNEAVPEAE